jgi:hypothetical protein
LSPLAALPFFNIVWDILGDMMHIIEGIWKRHIFKMLAGDPAPAKPRPRKTWTDEANRALAQDHIDVQAVLRKWSLPTEMRKVLLCSFCVLLIYIT